MRRAAKVDENQPDIVAALRQVGAFVQSLAAVGAGVPDLLVCRAGRVWLIEVKDPAQPPNKRALTPDQRSWHARCGVKVHVVLYARQALDVVLRGGEA